MAVMTTFFQKDLCQNSGPPRTAVVSAPDPRQATVNPHLHQRLLDTHRQGWLSLLWGHCSFPWVLVCTRFCWAFQESCFPVGSQPFSWIPSLGNLLWALELLQQCENFFGIIVLYFVGHLLGSPMVGLMVTSSKRT